MFFAKVWVDPNATLDVASSNTPITNLMGGSVLGHLGMKVNVARRAAETVVNAAARVGGNRHSKANMHRRHLNM